MIAARAGTGWQTTLADLSLILFMVTAATVSQQGPVGQTQARAARPSPRAEPLAVWEAGAGAPPLADWLALQAPDSRQQLTLVVPYRPGEASAAVAMAASLLRQGGPRSAGARVVIEPGEGPPVARLAHDRPALARPLQQGPEPSANRE